MSSEIAIKVEGLSKCYQIYNQPRDRLKQFVLPRLKRLVGQAPTQYFREFWALKDISFDLKRGASLGILGLNGAGKSTLLQTICGTVAPSSGKITVNGRVAALLELGAGFNPEFTGLENIYLNGTILGLTNQQISEKLDQILAFADIGDFIYQPIKNYSSGMYVRLAFSVAIHSNPDILVIDEALAVGDFIFQQKCNLFLKQNLSGVTKLFVSHDSSAVANLTEKALVLKQGRMIFFGESQLAIQEYQISSRASQGMLVSTEKESLFGMLDSTPGLREGDDEFADNVWIDVPPSALSGSLELTVHKCAWSIEGKKSFNIVQAEEMVIVSALIKGGKEIRSPIVGYQVQDRFGVVVFGENSVSSNIDISPISVGQSIMSMQIQWPEIPGGKYSFTLGIGSGEDSEAHEIICWAHNIIVFDSLAKRAVHGIFNNKIISSKLIPYEI